MRDQYYYGWGPSNVSKSLLFLLGGFATISIISALLDGLFVYYFSMNGPQSLLSLSWNGLREGYIWQPLTSLFVLSSGNRGLSFNFFIELIFDLYLLWIMGSNLISKVGSASFFTFYFFSGLSAGLLTLFCMPLLGQFSELAGPTSCLIAIIAAWTALHPESELLVFFLVPIKAKWLFSGFLTIVLLIALSHLNFILAAYYFFSLLIAYLYITMVWGLQTPFPIIHSIDNLFINLGNNIRSWRLWDKKFLKSMHPPIDKQSKIFDFHTGSPVLNDEEFMDQALDKISKQGEKSLTWSERLRMRKISEKRSTNKKG